MTSKRNTGSRPGTTLLAVGLGMLVLSWVVGVLSFFVPTTPVPGIGAWIIFLPGLVGFAGFGLAIAGLVVVLTSRGRQPQPDAEPPAT